MISKEIVVKELSLMDSFLTLTKEYKDNGLVTITITSSISPITDKQEVKLEDEPVIPTI